MSINNNLGRGETKPKPLMYGNVNKITMTDEEVDEFISEMSKVNEDNPEISTIKAITNGEPIVDAGVEDTPEDVGLSDEDIDKIEKEIEVKDVLTQIDPETGDFKGNYIAHGYGLDSDKDIFEELLDTSDIDESYGAIENLTSDEINKSIESQIKNKKLSEELTIADYSVIKNLMSKAKDGNTIKYRDLPPILKHHIDEMILSHSNVIPYNRHNEAKNMIANQVLQDMYMNILGDKLEQGFIDLGTGIKNLAMKEAKNINTESRKLYSSTYINNFPKLAEKYKDEDPKKAELLLKISNAYIQSYTLEDMYKMYTTTGKLKVKKIDIDKYKRVFSEFERKYEDSKYTIKSINNALSILFRHVNCRYTEMSIKAFFVIFCKYVQNMKPINVDEHTFMYYFIDNIVSLDMYNNNDPDDKKFYNDLIKNIEKFLQVITDKMHISE